MERVRDGGEILGAKSRKKAQDGSRSASRTFLPGGSPEFFFGRNWSNWVEIGRNGGWLRVVG